MTVGIAYRSNEPFATAWSAIPAGLARGLRELGVEALPLNVELPAPLQLAARTWARARYRDRRLASLAPEFRGLATSVARIRRRPLRRASLWVHCGRAVSDAPPPAGGAFVTFADMTIVQAARDNERVRRLPGRVVAAMRRSQLRRYREAAACCVASDWAAGSVVADYGIDASRVHVVGFGRNCDPRPVPRDRSEPRFLFAGLDWQRKNGDAVVRAFARVRDELPTARLDIVGGHPRLEVGGVVGHGPLRVDDPAARGQLEALFEQATCFVMPSRFEAFGMVYVEAGAAAVPSIGTTRGGAATAIADGGVLVDPDDEAALVDAMRALANPATADGLGRAALENASRYTWKGVAERILAAAEVAA